MESVENTELKRVESVENTSLESVTQINNRMCQNDSVWPGWLLKKLFRISTLVDLGSSAENKE